MFLVGAYQEIMGNLHNLFGDTNVVHIQMSPKGYDIEYLVKGDTITEVLGYVQYSAEDLLVEEFVFVVNKLCRKMA
jgi:arginine decarboxylase